MKNKLVLALSFMFLILLILFTNMETEGHEGHDEAPPSNNGAPLGDPFFVSKQTQFVLGITTDIAEEKQLNFTINSTGKLISTAKGKADVYSSLPGIILRGNIPQVGNNVRKGSTLVAVDQTLSLPEQLSIANEKYKAESEYEQSLKNYNRLNELVGVVAQKDLIDAEIKLKTSEKILNYYASLLKGNENSTNNYFSVTAPISGTIVESNVSAGEHIEHDKKLFTIIDINTLWVEADIYETDIAKLQNISNATVTTQTYRDEYFDAKLVSIGSVVDDVSRTVKVIFEVKNKNSLLKVGMFANIIINIETNNDYKALTVPKESIVDIGGKNVVFVHTNAQTFKGVEVLIGRSDGKYVEILSGLKAGARVVTTGNYQLRSSVK